MSNKPNNPLREFQTDQILALLTNGPKGVELYNTCRALDPEWRPYLVGAHMGETDDYIIDLTGLNLSSAIMGEASFCGEDLRTTMLQEADLYKADLRWTNLTGANLQKTDLRWAKLLKANLTGADLRGADLTGATLIEADLRGANLAGANTDCVNWYGAKINETTTMLPEDRKIVEATICRTKINK